VGGVASKAIVVCVDNAELLRTTLLRSELAQRDDVPVIQQVGFRSATQAFNDAMDRLDASCVVFVHQDVYLPRDWESQLDAAMIANPKASVLGVFGIDTNREFRGRVWSQGLGAELDFRVQTAAPVCALDEIVLVVRTESGLRFDQDLPGFHLYGTDIVQRALQAGHEAVVFDGPVVHNSRPVRNLDSTYSESYRYMQKMWRERLPIETCIMPLREDDSALVDWQKRNNRRQWSRIARALFLPHRRLVDPQHKAISLGYENA
jgi:glycosyl transferase family 2